MYYRYSTISKKKKKKKEKKEKKEKKKEKRKKNENENLLQLVFRCWWKSVRHKMKIDILASILKG